MVDPFTIGAVLLGAASLGLNTAKGIRDDKASKKAMEETIKKSVNEVISSKQRFRKLGK